MQQRSQWPLRTDAAHTIHSFTLYLDTQALSQDFIKKQKKHSVCLSSYVFKCIFKRMLQKLMNAKIPDYNQ